MRVYGLGFGSVGIGGFDFQDYGSGFCGSGFWFLDWDLGFRCRSG